MWINAKDRLQMQKMWKKISSDKSRCAKKF